MQGLCRVIGVLKNITRPAARKGKKPSIGVEHIGRAFRGGRMRYAPYKSKMATMLNRYVAKKTPNVKCTKVTAKFPVSGFIAFAPNDVLHKLLGQNHVLNA